MVRYMVVSSTNSLMLLLIESVMSLMYMRNRQGPSTDPCGTPDNTGQAPDCSQCLAEVYDYDIAFVATKHKWSNDYIQTNNNTWVQRNTVVTAIFSEMYLFAFLNLENIFT